jgi:hypothetical protein
MEETEGIRRNLNPMRRREGRDERNRGAEEVGERVSAGLGTHVRAASATYELSKHPNRPTNKSATWFKLTVNSTLR